VGVAIRKALNIILYMYVKVIPLTKLPRKIGIFDYLIPQKLQEKITIGQLVEITLRNRPQDGLIISIHKKSPIAKLKEILRLKDNKPFLNYNQISLLNWASFYYCSSPATFAKTMLPRQYGPPIRRSPAKSAGTGGPKQNKECPDIFKTVATESLVVKKSNISNIKQILHKIEKTKKTFLHWRDDKNKTAIYIKLLEKLSTTKQIILILPQLNGIIEFTKYLPLKLRQRTTILRCEMSRISYWQQWNTIRNKKEGIIIGTRQAIFAPTNNLGLIIIDDEHNISHKQWDQNPRYHTLKIAQQLQKLTSAKLLISSHTPSVTSYYASRKHNYNIITEKQSGDSKEAKKIEIINMQDEWRKKNYSIFSEKSINLLENIIPQQDRAIIYINRRGTSSLLACKDCGYTPQCPNCLIALPYVETPVSATGSAVLICRHCNHQEPIPIPCPRCHGSNIKHIGTGTEKVEKKINNLFPKLKTGRVDLGVKVDAINKTIQNFQNGKIGILIGTKAILSYHMPEKIDLIIFLNIDTDLQIPNFKAIELTLQTINGFKLLLKNQDNMIIQTYSKHCPLLNMLKDYSFDDFFKQELKNREKFKYPPFSQLIKLIYKHKNKITTQDESEKMINFLKKEFSSNKKIGISCPIFMPMNYGKYIVEILIKNSGSPDDLQEWMIENISNDWIIDVDTEI